MRTTSIFRTERIVAVLALALAGAAVAAPGPREVVERTTGDVVSVLGNEALDADGKREKILEIVTREADFPTISRLVLARHWRGLSEAQQDEFQVEFKQHLSATYGRNVENYDDDEVVILGDREEARGDWTVQTEVVRKSAKNLRIDYRVRQVDGEWKIIDVIAEGVSLVSNFRSQFQEIMTNGGFERLIELLREKNLPKPT